MIPDSEHVLTEAESARWRLTKLAAAIVRELGVSPDLLMRDCREGIEFGQAMAARERRRLS